jgi:hypothetical protein
MCLQDFAQINLDKSEPDTLLISCDVESMKTINKKDVFSEKELKEDIVLVFTDESITSEEKLTNYDIWFTRYNEDGTANKYGMAIQ